MSTGNTESAAAGAGSSGPGGKFIAIAAIAAVLLGVAGFFIGSSVKESDYKKGKSGYEKIYAEGYSAGQAAGSATGQKAGEAKGEKLGTAQGLETGKKAGEIIGKNEGVKEGKAEGYKQGYSEGFTAGVSKGASAVAGGFTNWSNNIPYVVELNPSPVQGVAQQVYTRTLMKAGTAYFLCPNGNSTCTQPLTP